MTEKLEGYVEHIIFRNEENGYTVLNLNIDGEELTCTGVFGALSEGESLRVSGSYTQHSVYGKQFHVENFEVLVPKDAVAIERYLSSGAVRGIKAVLAARIVRKFGDNTLKIMEEEPERLAEIKGISMKKAREIGEQIAEKTELRSAMMFLSEYGISLAMSAKVYQFYGDRIYQVIRENPYQLAEDIPGIGFQSADQIAQRAGIRPDSEFRIKSGLQFVLTQASAEGHCYLPEYKLLEKASQILLVDSADLAYYLDDLAIEGKVVRENGQDYENPVTGETETEIRIYLKRYYHLEMKAASLLVNLNIQCKDTDDSISDRLAVIEEQLGYSLEELQKRAVQEAAGHGVLILTGGPGTGKTTTINAMIRFFEQEGLSIRLAAPTGRAAKRMTETTGRDAQTIHRLLELSGTIDDDDRDMRFERNEENPLETDVVIIDEMSMVDIHLLLSLLSALTAGTRLILVGDVNQLPSVGPGSVLKDIIRSDVFQVVCLNRIFRQATKSDIVVNAHEINAGREVSIDNQSEDFFFLKRYDADIILRVIIALIQEKLPGYVDAKPFDIQVLTPMRKGMLGVEHLNEMLQRYLNPPSAKKREKEYGGRLFREGDKVMQIKNDYQLEWEVRGTYGIAVSSGVGIFNGDIGIVREINDYAELLIVEFDEGKFVEYTFKQLDELELAYAITIHKSQGSEYPAVILPLLSGPRLLMSRNLLYTAVTRARKCVTVVGSERTFYEMIHNSVELKRYTSLAERIIEMNELEKI